MVLRALCQHIYNGSSETEIPTFIQSLRNWVGNEIITNTNIVVGLKSSV